jgi:hypothetical protein
VVVLIVAINFLNDLDANGSAVGEMYNPSKFSPYCFIIISVIIVIYLIFINIKQNNYSDKQNEKIQIGIGIKNEKPQVGLGSWFNNIIPSYPYNNLPKDVLLNPYAPPLRDERYFIPELNYVPPGTIPINVSTNIGAVDTTYRQVGILNALNTKGKILPLMGRPLFVNRDKWQYYTISDQHNNVKLPVSRNGKSCTNEYGCDKLYNGDTIYIDGANEVYKVTIYDNDTIKYLPFL